MYLKPVKVTEYAILFLEILDDIQPTAVDPPREHHEQQLKRLKQCGQCIVGYRLTNLVRQRPTGSRPSDRVAPISGHYEVDQKMRRPRDGIVRAVLTTSPCS